MIEIIRKIGDEDTILITIEYQDGNHRQMFEVNDDEAMDIMFELGKFLGAKIEQA